MKINNKLISNIFTSFAKFQHLNDSDELNRYTLFDISKEDLFLTRRGRDFVATLKVDNKSFEKRENFKTLIDTKRMTDFLKSTPKKEKNLEISRENEKKVVIKIKNATYKITESLLVEEFERKVSYINDVELLASLDLKQFMSSVEDVVKVVKEDVGTIKELINFKISDKLHLTTTDGYRIANCNTEANISKTHDFSIKGRLVRNMIEALEVLNTNDDSDSTRIEISKAKNMIVFRVNDFVIMLNASEIKYNDFTKAFFEREIARIEVNAPLFTEKLKRINSFVANDVKKISLEYGNECKLISEEESVGHSANETLETINFDGKKGKISFTADLLWLCLERYSGDVEIKIIERGRLVISSKDKTLIFVVLTFTN